MMTCRFLLSMLKAFLELTLKVLVQLVELPAIRDKKLQENKRLLSVHYLSRRVARLITKIPDYRKDARKVSIQVFLDF